MKNKWIKIGEVGVDSGGLMITDPCYVKDFDNSEWDEATIKSLKGPVFPYGYNGYCAATNTDKMAGRMGFGLGGSTGVCFTSGYGDGCYPVFARYSKDGRIAEVRIKMIDEDGNHPYDDDWDDDIDENS